jgi:hypothetical protein
MTSDNLGIIYVTGRSFRASNSYEEYDCLTLAYSNSGDLLWSMRYDSPGGDWQEPKSIVADSAGNVYVTGFSWGSSNNTGFFIVKYSPIVTDVRDNNRVTVPLDWSLSQNYPNPFNPSTTIRFSLPSSGYVTLDVYNILGQKVRTLVDENLTAGYKQIFWDGTNQQGQPVSSGIYFYRLKTDSFSETKKMVLMK